MAIDLTKFNLRKQIVLDLTKSKGIENQKAQVMLCMDISYSMEDMYLSGLVQDVVERIVPIAMQFDDNGELDLYMFQSDCKKHKDNVKLNNIENFVKREILGKYSFGGTNYAPPIKMIQNDVVGEEKSGFLGFGSKSAVKKFKYPAYIIFITDGENGDRADAERAIIEASKHGIFFQFVGIGGASFNFLQRLDNLEGRFIDNANFFQIKDIKSTSDADLYSKLLAEFPEWLKLAKEKNLIEA